MRLFRGDNTRLDKAHHAHRTDAESVSGLSLCDPAVILLGLDTESWNPMLPAESGYMPRRPRFVCSAASRLP